MMAKLTLDISNRLGYIATSVRHAWTAGFTHIHGARQLDCLACICTRFFKIIYNTRYKKLPIINIMRALTCAYVSARVMKVGFMQSF